MKVFRNYLITLCFTVLQVTNRNSLTPELLYVGDGSYWRWLPKTKHHKNPDFILPGSDTDHPKRGVSKVVEVFGDFWHSEVITGLNPIDHVLELVEAFQDIGMECLVVWESEVNKKPAEVREKVLAFLSAGVSTSP